MRAHLTCAGGWRTGGARVAHMHTMPHRPVANHFSTAARRGNEGLNEGPCSFANPAPPPARRHSLALNGCGDGRPLPMGGSTLVVMSESGAPVKEML